MPQTRSPWPKSSRSVIWLQIADALRNDSQLKTTVDTWQLLDGSTQSQVKPTEANLPLLRMTPAGGSQRWADESTQECTLNLKIEIGVTGTDVTAIFDFWSAVETALFTGNTLLNAMQSGLGQGIQKTITTPAVAVHLFGETTGLAAEGILTVKMRINS